MFGTGGFAGAFAMGHCFFRRIGLIQLRALGFQRGEGGGMIVFGLVFMILMLMMGGLAVDLMRFEHTRTRLQNTLDRATLAAASLDKVLDTAAVITPTSVVTDYMGKAGLADQLTAVEVISDATKHIVRGIGVADTNPLFLHMLGIDTLDAHATSAAAQAIRHLEIVLVLGVSNSMNVDGKINKMKDAAKDFVDAMTANDPDQRVSITIVPYNSGVNIGPDLALKFNLTHRHGVSDVNCVEIPASGFNTQALSLTNPMPMTAYADTWSGTDLKNTYIQPNDADLAIAKFVRPPCLKSTVNIVRLPSNDPATLKARINALTADGTSAIMLGMKWGIALLDPSMRSSYTDFISQGKIPATLPGRPFNYSDPRAMKIVVLITDGWMLEHERINDAYKTGPSPIWKAPDGKYSVNITGTRPTWAYGHTWYVPHVGDYQAEKYGGADAVQQDWKDIWAKLRLDYVLWQFYARPQGTAKGSASTTIYNQTDVAMAGNYMAKTAMESSLQTSCTKARANGVVIYAIGIDTGAADKGKLTSCATAARTFFANRDTVRTAFRAIAANLTMLQLTE